MKIPAGETTHCKRDIKKSVHFSHRISCAMKPANVLVIRLNLSEHYERQFYRNFEWCVCVSFWKQADMAVSKTHAALSFICVYKLSSEILRIGPESLE